MRKTLVPALVGLDCGDAFALAMDSGVVIMSDRDGGLASGGRVVGQAPQAGTQVYAASEVLVEFDDPPDDDCGGGDGPLPPEPVPPMGPSGATSSTA
ncbi:PASTA domain-containing protein [Pseudonocardia sp.]|uniref:PASTA domain-containing protein n=1 Tax=Pseudonocardia sp. TaxID=60912 RepID=UPI003D0F882C